VLSYATFCFFGFPKRQNINEPATAMMLNIMNKVDYLDLFFKTKPAISPPMTFELMKNAQKKLLKKPLFSSHAHSATYAPWETQRTPAPAPLMTAVKISRNLMRLLFKIQMSGSFPS